MPSPKDHASYGGAQATFLVPFARLSIPPEGCSSVHFERLMGAEAAQRMLAQGWKPSAAEAKEIGRQ